MLVIIGADENVEIEHLFIMHAFCEIADTWRGLPTAIEKRGLTVPPELAMGDGALGLWTALRDVVSMKREHRCELDEAVDATGVISNRAYYNKPLKSFNK